MLHRLFQRLLPVLQLTRMALVFTAISNAFATMLLVRARWAYPGKVELSASDLPEFLAVAATSIGLYGFGMSLNDIIDHRRDRQLAAHRPLPSGRINLHTAHGVCAFLAALALAGAIAYARLSEIGDTVLLLVLFTLLLICFYDFAGKYLPALGLLTLGLIRFFHGVVPSPRPPVLYHPLLMFTHVTLLSTLAYLWEEKRPTLTRLHYVTVFGGLAVVNVLAGALVAFRSWASPHHGALWPTTGLAYPVAAVLGFGALAVYVFRTAASSRQAGQTLMLAGLLWLIVYDAAFVAAYVGVIHALWVLILLPVAYLSVVVMRWWSKLLAISQQPEFKRTRSDSPPGP